jgi:hypothetical protein
MGYSIYGEKRPTKVFHSAFDFIALLTLITAWLLCLYSLYRAIVGPIRKSPFRKEIIVLCVWGIGYLLMLVAYIYFETPPLLTWFILLTFTLGMLHMVTLQLKLLQALCQLGNMVTPKSIRRYELFNYVLFVITCFGCIEVLMNLGTRDIGAFGYVS